MWSSSLNTTTAPENRNHHPNTDNDIGTSPTNTTTWSPFDCFVVADQTASGLLQTFPNEVEMSIFDTVELRSCSSTTTSTEEGAAAGGGDSSRTQMMSVPLTADNQIDHIKLTDPHWKYVDRCSGLQVMITTHRLVFIQDRSRGGLKQTTTTTTTSPGMRMARYLHFSNIFDVTTETALFKSPKIILSTSLGEFMVAFTTGSDRKKNRDDFYEECQTILSRREWEKDEKQQLQQLMQQQKTTTATGQHRRVGVDAIVTATKTRHRQAAQITDAAFTGDAERFLQEAIELVSIIHKYVATLEQHSTHAATASAADSFQEEGATGSSSSSSSDTQKLVQLLSNMGMTSALTKADFGRDREHQFYEMTARQIFDFVRPKLQSTGGMMTLTDLYCLFNRARGTHLLSPEDLVLSIQVLETLQLGLSVYTFPDSGLQVLRDQDISDRALQDLLELARTLGHVTAMTAARQFHIPTLLATEQLFLAEQRQLLVRDETLETIRYYPNRFDEWMACLNERRH
jgi:ESCRT-II complex subunit VPS36